MPGTLSATIAPAIIVVPRNADFATIGALDVQSMIPVFSSSATLAGAGALSATALAKYASSAALASSGAFASTATQQYSPATSFAAAGTLSATVVPGTLPLRYVSGAAATAATVAMSAHQAGDLIVAVGWTDAVNDFPTAPAGWTQFNTGNSSGLAGMTYAMKVAQSSSETVGTWTKTTAIAVAVYRSDYGIGGINISAAGAGASTTITYPALTLASTIGKSWIHRAAGHRTATNMTANTPAGYTARAAIGDLRIIDSNGAVSTSPTSATQSVNTSADWLATTAEILDGDNGSAFSDDFTSGTLNARWLTALVFTATVSVVSGRLRLNINSSFGGGATCWTRDVMSLVGKSLTFQVPTIPNGGATTTISASGCFGLIASGGNGSFGGNIVHGLSVTTDGKTAWNLNKVINGAVTVLATKVYATGNWFRFRESGGTYFIDMSTTGTTWTNYASMTFPAPLAGRFLMSVGSGVAGTVTGEFDNVAFS